MLEMQQSGEAGDLIIPTFLDILCREGIRATEATTKVLRNIRRVGVCLPSRISVERRSRLGISEISPRRPVRWFENEIEARYEATGGSLDVIADVLQEGIEDPKSFGLAFVHVAAGGGSSNGEPFAIARSQMEHLRRYIEQLAAKMGLQHPDMAASAAVFVIERAIVRTLMTGGLREVHAARLLFQCLQHA